MALALFLATAAGGGGGDGNISLSWDAVSGASGYKVKYGTQIGNYGTSADVGNVTSYTFPVLTEGQQYFVVVVAYDGSSVEGWQSAPYEFWSPNLDQIYHVAKTGNDTTGNGSSGNPWLTIQKAHDTATTAGDMIVVHAGTYTERIVLRHGGSSVNAPIYYKAAEGESVTIQYTSSVEAFTGSWYAPGSGNTLYSGEGAKNYLTFDGFNVGGSAGSGFFVAYRGGNSNGQYWTLKNITASGLSSKLFFFEGKGIKVHNCDVDHCDEAMGWYFGGNTGTDDFEVRRSSGFSNNPGGAANADGITLQDVDNFLVEDSDFYGVDPGTAPPTNPDYQYDGLDFGSQSTTPGCTSGIIRRVRAYSNSNTNFPNSTTITGPITFQYSLHYDNYNWGSAVTYEGSTNVEYWNITAEDVGTAFNYFDSPVSGVMTLKNSLVVLRNAGDDVFGLSGSGSITHDYNRKSTTGNWGGGQSAQANETVGSPGFNDASYQSSRDYRLSSGSAAVNAGTFFIFTSSGGTTTTTVSVGTDPRKYFWPGDEIQVQDATGTGVTGGRVNVISMTSNSITVDRAITFSTSKGVHLPWVGTAPDLGAYEYMDTTLPRPTNLYVDLGV